MWRLAALLAIVPAVHSQTGPPAKLQGRVLYPDGSPVAGAQVLALLESNMGASMTKTDDQGRFAFDAALRGRFILAARPPAALKPSAGGAWAPTLFPNAIDRRDAELIRLKPGADVSGYDIRLRRLPVFRLRGVVRDDLGKPAAGARIEFASPDSLFAVEAQIVSGQDGEFAAEVRAGNWRLTASLKRGDVTLRSIQSVTTRSDLDDVELRLDHPFQLSGLAEGPRPPKGAVRLQAEAPRESFAVHSSQEEDGAIVFKAVYPGRYRIIPLGLKSGSYLESVKLGDREVLGEIVDLVEGSPPLRVTYQSGAPSVRVHVDKGAGARVVIVPQNEVLLNEQFIRDAKADADGRCVVGNLRPGEYYAFAFDRVELGDVQDPAFLQLLIPRAEKVHVEKGETASVDLKVTPWPE
jgi:hypothetical protein